MKYFIDEIARKASGSSCYFEFMIGEYHDECWLADSISISDEIFDELKLYELIGSTVPSFDYYGLTEVNLSQWQSIVCNARNIGGDVKDAILEADEWAQKAFSTSKVITICGL